MESTLLHLPLEEAVRGRYKRKEEGKSG